MFSYRAIAIAAALIPFACNAPAVADTSVRLQSTLIADLGRDQITLSQHNVASARVVSGIVEMPAFEQAVGRSGEAVVQIDLDRSGRVTSALLSKSSGSARMDKAAIDAAYQSLYAPATIDGKAVSRTYALEIDFKP